MRSENSDRTEIATYDEFVGEMFREGWRFLENKTPHIVTNKDTGIVSTYPIIAGGYGPFLELKCPQDHVLTINGLNQRPVMPHYLSIRCRDDTLYELRGGTRLSMMKRDRDNLPAFNHFLFYDEISQTRGSRFKQEGERYYLQEKGIILYEREKLQFYVYESDIDIIRTDFLMKCDIFVKGTGVEAGNI